MSSTTENSTPAAVVPTDSASTTIASTSASTIDRRAFQRKLALASAATTAAVMLPGVSFGAWTEIDADGSDRDD